jgi:hypothetical protein
MYSSEEWRQENKQGRGGVFFCLLSLLLYRGENGLNYLGQIWKRRY